MNGEQGRDPFLLDQVLEERGLARLCNIPEGKSEESIIWIPREFLRFLGSDSKNLIVDRKTCNGDDIAGHSA